MKRAVSIFFLLTGFRSSALAQIDRHGPDSGLLLRLEVTQPAFKSGALVIFRIFVENGRSGCKTRLFDRVVSGDPSPRRPVSLLDFEILDDRGKRIARGTHSEPNWAIMDPRTLMRLDCWESFGRAVMPGSGEWGYRLPAGRYRVRARLALKLREFFSQRPSLMKESAEWTGMKPESFMDALADEMLVSDDVGFEIQP